MKAVVTQENFAKALSYISRAVSSNPSIPILSNVLIEISDGEMKLSTTDLEFGITTLLGADVKQEGKITVDARTLSEFVNSLTSGKLTIELKDKIFEVKNAFNSADFNTIDAEEFPPLPKPGSKVSFKVKALPFAKAITQVAMSAAAEDSRPVLTGILFEATERKLSMVGVDGFRLSKKNLVIERKEAKDFTHIVPAKTLQELARIAQDVAEEKTMLEVYLLGEKNQMLFKLKDAELSTRLIEGEFPDYKQILPKEVKYKFSADKESFAQTVKVVSIFARSAVGNKAVLEFMPAKNSVRLSAQVADVGENESTVEVHDVEGDEMKTAYNTKFLTDMVNVVDGEEILFETNGVTAPGVFRDKDDKEFLHIIMPMRLD